MTLPNVAQMASRLNAFSNESAQIFSQIESSKSRRVTLDESYRKLESLSLKQDDLFRQALRCVEVSVFRAAHVMAWAGLVDCLQSLVASDQFAKLNAAYPDWQIASVDTLRENRTEFSLIDAIYKTGCIGKAEKKALHGMLSKRNECAHPADYYPNFNETLGYISEAFSRLYAIEQRFPNFSLS